MAVKYDELPVHRLSSCLRSLQIIKDEQGIHSFILEHYSLLWFMHRGSFHVFREITHPIPSYPMVVAAVVQHQWLDWMHVEKVLYVQLVDSSNRANSNSSYTSRKTNHLKLKDVAETHVGWLLTKELVKKFEKPWGRRKKNEGTQKGRQGSFTRYFKKLGVNSKFSDIMRLWKNQPKYNSLRFLPPIFIATVIFVTSAFFLRPSRKDAGG